MKNKLNKKGFTLVELLAVIVVLAIIIVIAAPQVLDAMNKAKKKSFQLEGQRVLQAAMATYMADQVISSSIATKCYSLSDMKLTADGFQGYVIIFGSSLESSQSTGSYYLYLTNKTYQYNGISYANVYADNAPGLSTLGSGDTMVQATCPSTLPTTPPTQPGASS